MNMGDFFKELKLDAWYKVLMVVGAVLFVVALTVDVKVMTNSQLALLSGGFFFIGLGIWKGIMTEVGVLPPNVYRGGAWKVEHEFWRPELGGCLLDIVGIVLVVLFLASLLRPSQPLPTAPAATAPATAQSVSTAAATP